jgi:hypothetical protein
VAVGSQQYAITTAAAVIAQAPTVPNAGPVGAVLVTNMTGSAVTAYLGGSRVTTSTGYPLAQNASVAVTLYSGDTLYAISGSTATLAVLQT